MNIFIIFAFIPLIIKFVLTDAPTEASPAGVPGTGAVPSSSDSPSSSAPGQPSNAPVLEELTVLRQKEYFVARKYKNYDTTTVQPTYIYRIFGYPTSTMCSIPDPYQIRQMTLKDVEELMNFKVNEFTIIYPVRVYHRHVKYYPSLSLVLEVNNNMEGFIIGSNTSDQGVLYGHITSIFINENFRGFGFGAKLMREFEENSRLLNCKYVNLFVNLRNTSAIEFYKSRNYYVHHKIPRYYNDTEDAFEMRKTLI